ncbi:MAG: helix-turn-helix transcriptional regulator [Clostridium sp.]|nr:helix-turn-helix transcriptional regulator [Clostridium sp.]
MDNLGSRIRTLRKSLKMTQADLSCEILNRSSVCKIEKNLIVPSLFQLEHIASKLNVTVADLIYNSNTSDNLDANTQVETSNDNIKSLFEDEKYFDIIDFHMTPSFFSYFYKGMSYYRIDLEKEAKKYLDKCENLFNNMNDVDKFLNVEKLCIALNSLRKINIKSLENIENLHSLKNILSYLTIYRGGNLEIYYVTINNIGAYYLHNENFESAISFIENFLRDNSRFAYTSIFASIHSNLSIAKFAIRSYIDAISHIKKAIFFYKYAHDNFQACECYINLYNYYLYTKSYKECFKLCDYLASEFNIPEINETFKILRLILLYNIGNREKFIHYIKSINTNALRKKSRYDYFFLMGKVNFFLGKFDVAFGYYRKCISYLELTKRYLDLSIIYNDLYYIYGIEEYLYKYKKYNLLSNNRIFNPIHPDITIINL